MTRLTRMMSANRDQHGNQCVLCASTKRLQFAHIKPTPTHNGGRGRGGLKRAYDILRNEDCFRLMCEPCHRKYDTFMRACLEARRKQSKRWYLGKRTR